MQTQEAPYTTEEAIDIGLTLNSLNIAVTKTCSKEPDSLGDQLFRMALALSFTFSYKTKEDTFILLQNAKDLLQTYEKGKAT